MRLLMLLPQRLSKTIESILKGTPLKSTAPKSSERTFPPRLIRLLLEVAQTDCHKQRRRSDYKPRTALTGLVYDYRPEET